MTQEEVRELWFQALESGEYQQGTGRLRRKRSTGGERFCILGVLADVAIKHNLIQNYCWEPRPQPLCAFELVKKGSFGQDILRTSLSLPDEIADLAGIWWETAGSIAEDNDALKFTFKDARNYITKILNDEN